MSSPQPPRTGPLRALVADLIDRHLRIVAAGERRVVGLCGPPGAGKSTAADLLVGLLRDAGIPAAAAPMDGFHLSNHRLDARGTRSRKGAPETFDVAGFAALLRRIRDDRTETVHAPEYSRRLHEPIAAFHEITPETRVVVTEGNYLLLGDGGWERIRPLLDLVVYLDAPGDELAARLIRRHRATGSTAEQAAEWVRTVDMPNARTVARTRDRADLVWCPVEGNDRGAGAARWSRADASVRGPGPVP
ncbi:MULTISPECIES: nucleoside/nucleotide kinase family protein [Rhodococcus]|uniref:Nucleoside/nucleotide kinase family protein n=1 Tax=Rhodococcus aetherivorans TaxID=191292 RepID=A0AA46PGA8_9NOCA|nr:MULTISPECIES: nucleoside/nucleotide kinase family protein [Rhodococcus]NCL76363.1 Pantothenate kinase [Rhodococcus sp. YH1]AKE88618.1 GCN5 family acetyltransferase [Rhodococcus aetherivorans]ANZ26714.1 nucleoside/nucleotide kinase family protein [Rhodococcus sp. WB1]MDV6297194.1 nucleoside/nucleotide kinase family protein [Rhodococcus aetherivorans]QRI75941.1 nucleoside/nucleotide kinase family protein [Rhodococcus aetherivorans]